MNRNTAGSALSVGALVLVFAAAARGSEVLPRLLQPHPAHRSDLPYWVAASYAIRPDGGVSDRKVIGAARAAALSRRLKSPPTASVSDDTPPEDLGCELTPEEAAAMLEVTLLAEQTVFLPGDFRGWVAASEAVVAGTVEGFVPGFDEEGAPNTLVLLSDTEHLYQTSRYPYGVKYVILPYARFVAGGRVFCGPPGISVEYYPQIGDRLLIAADLPADKDGLAMTVRSLSRVARIDARGGLVTYEQSDDYRVVFASDFPETIDEARTRAWHVWRDGFVDLADTLGHDEFTRLWRGVKADAADAVRSGCFVIGAHPVEDGWSLSVSCPPEQETAAADAKGHAR